jgi:SAM-dependent methyltransferase
VFLHASLERRHEARSSDVRSELSEAGFDSRLVEANVAKLEKLMRSLSSGLARSSWQGYRATCSYDEQDRAVKEQFVRRAVSRRRLRLVWDLGCNDGRFSRIASQDADLTLAIDSDAPTVDELYRSLRESTGSTILPLVVDLADQSPRLGWRNAERGTLLDRGSPDLTLCLALVHHLSIGRNLPLREIVDWLRGLGSELVVEFAHRDDPMVERLLGRKRHGAHPDYELEAFERLLGQSFEIVESSELPSGTRTLYLARPA